MEELKDNQSSQNPTPRERLQERLEAAEQRSEQGKKYDDIFKEIDALLEQIPPVAKDSSSNSKENYQDLRVNYLSKRADILYDYLGDYEKAFECYVVLNTLLLGHPKIQKSLGDCLRKQGQHTEAIEQYDKVLKGGHPLDKKFKASIRNNKALSYIVLSITNPEELASAESALQTAVKEDPENVLYLCNLGRVLDLQNKTQLALESFQKAQILVKDQKFGSKIVEANKVYFEAVLSNLIYLREIQNSFQNQNNPDAPDQQRIQNFMMDIYKKSNEFLNFETFAAKCREGMVELPTFEEKLNFMMSLLLRMLEEMRSMRNEMREGFKNILQTQNKILVEIEKIKSELNTKLIDYEKVILGEIKDENHKTIIREYYEGFTRTLNSIYMVSVIVRSGKVEVSPPISASLVTGLVSALPWIPAGILKIIITTVVDVVMKIVEFFMVAKMRRDATNILVLGNQTQFAQRIGETASIILSSDYKKKILNIPEEGLQEFTDGMFKKLLSFAKKFPDKLDSKLYGRLYKTPAAVLGNRDASLLIAKWLSGKISEETSPEELASIVVKQTNHLSLLPELEPKDSDKQENQKRTI